MTPMLAYLDPGSGSALFGTLLALGGAAAYSLKSVVFRLFTGKSNEARRSSGIAIFSEGKAYWGTFKPIVEEFIRRGITIDYYTLDLYDPALEIDSPYLNSRLFDRQSASAFRRLESVKAKFLLATTPNIGTPGYPLRRPKGVERLVHVFHAPANIAHYHIGSLDNYDDVLMTDDHEIAPIREVERKRGLREKNLFSVGIPYLDGYARRLREADRPESQKKTVLVASSWGKKGLLREYGTGFIADLAKAGYDVVVRPHPQSFVSEPEFIKACQQELAEFTNVSWDVEPDGFPSMMKSAVMVSDTSGVRFDFAYVFAKPVVTLEVPKGQLIDFEGVNMESIWVDEVTPKLGAFVRRDEVGTIFEVVGKVLDGDLAGSGIAAWRDSVLANFGRAGAAVVDWFVKAANIPTEA